MEASLPGTLGTNNKLYIIYLHIQIGKLSYVVSPRPFFHQGGFQIFY